MIHWWPDISVGEIVIRSLTVFFFLLVVIRAVGKRDVGEMSPSDLILLLLLSANVHTSLSGSDESILGGLIGAAVLMMANRILNRIGYRFQGFDRWLKGYPELIIFNGKPCEKIMRKHHLSEMMLKVAIRKEGLATFSEVRMAVLEPDGTISVIPQEKKAA